jgi:hypothetical protein
MARKRNILFRRPPPEQLREGGNLLADRGLVRTALKPCRPEARYRTVEWLCETLRNSPPAEKGRRVSNCGAAPDIYLVEGDLPVGTLATPERLA